MPPSTTDSPEVPASGGPCTGRFEICQRYPFSLPRNATLTVYLEWYVGTNDLDLLLFQGGSLVDDDAATANSRGEFLRSKLPPGDYEVVVDGYLVTATAVGGTNVEAGTRYRLQIFFDELGAPNP